MRWFDQDWSLGCGVAHGDDTTQGECGVGFALPVYQRGGHEIGAAIDLGRHVGMALFWEGSLAGSTRLNLKAGYGMRGELSGPGFEIGFKEPLSKHAFWTVHYRHNTYREEETGQSVPFDFIGAAMGFRLRGFRGR